MASKSGQGTALRHKSHVQSMRLLSHLVVHLLIRHWQRNLLLKDIAYAIQFDCLAPVIKRAGDKHFVRIVRPGRMRGSASVSDQIHPESFKLMTLKKARL